MKPIYIPHGVSVPANTLCVDGSISGARVCYSHWVGVDSPKEIAHDLSTGILLNAAKDPETYFKDFEYVANNHVDADGILSMAVALDPELLEYEQIMLDAAAYGDFNFYNSEAGARLALRLHQGMRNCAGQYGDGWEHKACELLPSQVRQFIDESQQADKERDAQVFIINKRIDDIDDGTITLTDHKHFTQVTCAYEFGHYANDYLNVFIRDDLPLWSLNTRIGPDQFQLLCSTSRDGTYAQLNAPTHSWALTTELPIITIPNTQAAREALQNEEETKDAQWVCAPEANKLDYTCVLGFMYKDGIPAASSIGVERICEIISAHL